MILKTTNNRLYDSRNFDNHKNYYAILLDKRKLELIEKTNSDNENIYIVKVQRILETLLLDIMNPSYISDNVKPYNIVYGHFYNDQNYFLFKKIHNDKIIAAHINKCQQSELWHNKYDKLYISNYFEDTKQTVAILNNNIHTSARKDPETLSLIVYDNDSETLYFKRMWKSEYGDETVEMITIQPYSILVA